MVTIITESVMVQTLDLSQKQKLVIIIRNNIVLEHLRTIFQQYRMNYMRNNIYVSTPNE